jgi:hypothetical protein
MGPLEYLIIGIAPSFEPGDSFAIAPIEDESTSRIRYLLKYECHIGDKTKEGAKGQIQLSQAQAESLSELCRSLSIGLIPINSEEWLDGTRTTVTISQGGNKLTMSWSQVPGPWKPIEALIEMIRAMVRDACRDNRIN